MRGSPQDSASRRRSTNRRSYVAVRLWLPPRQGRLLQKILRTGPDGNQEKTSDLPGAREPAVLLSFAGNSGQTVQAAARLPPKRGQNAEY